MLAPNSGPLKILLITNTFVLQFLSICIRTFEFCNHCRLKVITQAHLFIGCSVATSSLFSGKDIFHVCAIFVVELPMITLFVSDICPCHHYDQLSTNVSLSYPS